jgi:hypothetical protein
MRGAKTPISLIVGVNLYKMKDEDNTNKLIEVLSSIILKQFKKKYFYFSNGKEAKNGPPETKSDPRTTN